MARPTFSFVRWVGEQGSVFLVFQWGGSTTPRQAQLWNLPSLSFRVDMDQKHYDILQEQLRVLSQILTGVYITVHFLVRQVQPGQFRNFDTGSSFVGS